MQGISCPERLGSPINLLPYKHSISSPPEGLWRPTTLWRPTLSQALSDWVTQRWAARWAAGEPPEAHLL